MKCHLGVVVSQYLEALNVHIPYWMPSETNINIKTYS